MQQDHSRHALRSSLVTAIAPCIWGSTYIVTTQLLPPDRPLTAACLRVLPVGLLMVAAKRTLPEETKWWWRMLFLGLLNIGVFQALLFIAAYRLPGGVAATVIATQPVFVVMLSRMLLQTRQTPMAWVAAFSGLIGVALLVLTPAARLDGVGIVAAFAGAGCMALGTVLTKRWISPLPTAVFTGWQLVFGGLFLLPFALLFEEPPAALSVKNVLGYAYLGILGTGITYMIWFWGIRRLQASAVALLGLLSPIMATLLGYLVLGQSMTALQFVGGGVVLWSIWAGQSRTAR